MYVLNIMISAFSILLYRIFSIFSCVAYNINSLSIRYSLMFILKYCVADCDIIYH